MRRLTILLLLVLCACAAQWAAAPGAAPRHSSAATQKGDEAPPPRDDGRLPDLATPLRYAVALNVDPTRPRFSGITTILTAVRVPTSYLVLHARRLNITRVVARVDGQEILAAPSTRLAHRGREPDELVLAFARPLPAATVTLELTYDAAFAPSLAGLYRTVDRGESYAFTQFEATDARSAFPCFDEPGFKVAFDVTLRVPSGMIAASNGKETARHDEGDSTRFEFATTPPLPTYLVAFAVGPFDVREGAKSPVPIRLLAAKGKGKYADLALEAAAGLTQKLANYFGIAYPYAKLDLVAVPNFASGAMENAGLITFREERLLLDPAHTSVSSRRGLLQVVAHELSHHWFGDMVTMAWWNDLWLNEGFATWAGPKAIDAYKPAFGARVEQVANLQGVMDSDALRSARAVRQPVTSTDEAREAFDGITYRKGAAVLGMLEHTLGEGTFQKGVRAYLYDHAWGNATADDLLKAFDRASGRDASGIASGFLNRPGVPNIAVALDCGKGARPQSGVGIRVSVTESAWHRLGAPDADPKTLWNVPVSMMTATGDKIDILLAPDKPSAEVALTKCPAWVYPNADDAGYYRFSLDDKGWSALGADLGRLPLSSKLGFVSNLWAQARAGKLSMDVVLRTLPRLDGEHHRYPVDQELAVLREMSHAVVNDDARAAFGSYAAERLVAHQRALGLSVSLPQATDANGGNGPVLTARAPGAKLDEERTLLRASLASGLAELSNDEATLRDAEKASDAWLRDPSSVDGDLAGIMVTLASRRASADRIERLLSAARASKTPENRLIAVHALGGFGDPTILRSALDTIFTDDVRAQDVHSILSTAMGHHASERTVLDWVMANWDKLKNKVPAHLSSRIVGLVGVVCGREDREKVTSFFSARSSELEGAARPLAQALEEASLCEAMRDANAAAVSRYFATPGAGPRPGAAAKP